MAIIPYQPTAPNDKKWCDHCRRRGEPQYVEATRRCPYCGFVYCGTCAAYGCPCQIDD